MHQNEGDQWAHFRDLTEIMENTEQKQIPADFTSVVMTQLSGSQEENHSHFLRRFFPTALDFDFSDHVTQRECAFYFYLTGFFYLVFGFILLLGLRPSTVLINSEWLTFQPVFGLLLAAGLVLMGTAVYQDGGNIPMRFIRAGTLIYASLIVINGFTGAFFVRIPVAALFNVIFSITGLGTAFLLGLAVNRCCPKNIHQEV